MKFTFSTTNNNQDRAHIFHENLFKNSPKSIISDSESEDSDSDNEYTNDEIDLNESTTTNQLQINDLSLPLTDTIAEFVQELSKDKFFINDISFIFELSRKRAISPCAIVVALIYLKRLKIKTNLLNNFEPITNESSSNYPYNKNYEKYSANCLSNTELCLISLLLASKYLVDEGEANEIYNDEWAELLDYSVEKVNLIERTILKQLVNYKSFSKLIT